MLLTDDHILIISYTSKKCFKLRKIFNTSLKQVLFCMIICTIIKSNVQIQLTGQGEKGTERAVSF